MKNDSIFGQVLGVKMIPNVSPYLAKEFNLKPFQKSLGIITGDIDDIVFTALDEATKSSDVEVVYAESMYAGSDYPSSPLAGEVIGILAGRNPEEVRSGLNVAVDKIENEVHFISANDDDSIIYFAHCVSRTGSFLSKEANIPEGEAIAYLIAPPLEAMYALDFAIKAAAVEVKAFFGPPTETNFGGAMLTGNQSACQAACDAFSDAVQRVAENPKEY